MDRSKCVCLILEESDTGRIDLTDHADCASVGASNFLRRAGAQPLWFGTGVRIIGDGQLVIGNSEADAMYANGEDNRLFGSNAVPNSARPPRGVAALKTGRVSHFGLGHRLDGDDHLTMAGSGGLMAGSGGDDVCTDLGDNGVFCSRRLSRTP